MSRTMKYGPKVMWIGTRRQENEKKNTNQLKNRCSNHHRSVILSNKKSQLIKVLTDITRNTTKKMFSCITHTHIRTLWIQRFLISSRWLVWFWCQKLYAFIGGGKACGLLGLFSIRSGNSDWIQCMHPRWNKPTKREGKRGKRTNDRKRGLERRWRK